MRLRELGALGEHVRYGDGAEFEAFLQQVELCLIGDDEIARDLDLRGVGSVGDRRGDDVRGEREISRLELEALTLGGGGVALDRARGLAENVRREGDPDIDVVERVDLRRVRGAGRARGR